MAGGSSVVTSQLRTGEKGDVRLKEVYSRHYVSSGEGENEPK